MEAMESWNVTGNGEELVRIQCNIPEASATLDGIWFGKVGEVRVSEPVSAKKASRYFSIPGFAKWKGEDDDAERADADIRSAQSTSLTGLVATADQKAEVDGLKASNLRLSEDLYAANQRGDVAEANNVKLRKQLAKMGANPAPIAGAEEEEYVAPIKTKRTAKE